MFKYRIEVYRTSENDFWRLHRTYSGASLSNPLEDAPILGKAFRVEIESKNPFTLRGLQAEFPNLDITKLSEVETQLTHQ